MSFSVATARHAGKLESAIPELAPSIPVAQMGNLLIFVSTVPVLAFMGTAVYSVRQGVLDKTIVCALDGRMSQVYVVCGCTYQQPRKKKGHEGQFVLFLVAAQKRLEVSSPLLQTWDRQRTTDNRQQTTGN